MITALFVDPKGPYPKLGLDCWTAERDARLFSGSNPIIAHPPCQLWGPFAKINYARWGGEHNRPGNDGGCFQKALDTVRQNGGVLEHPAYTNAWKKYGLLRPYGIGWTRASSQEWVCEVWQSAYGHRARKKTWLLYVGRHRPLDANWAREPGTHQCGQHDQRGKEKNKPTLSKRESSETPLPFAQYLLTLASESQNV